MTRDQEVEVYYRSYTLCSLWDSWPISEMRGKGCLFFPVLERVNSFSVTVTFGWKSKWKPMAENNRLLSFVFSFLSFFIYVWFVYFGCLFHLEKSRFLSLITEAHFKWFKFLFHLFKCCFIFLLKLLVCVRAYKREREGDCFISIMTLCGVPLASAVSCNGRTN